MNERDYMNADYEVIRMVNKGRGPGGELPSVALTFIPKERVEHVEAMDLRIEQIRNAMPYVSAAALLLLGFILGWAM